jgi:hypothetical protein
LYVIGFLPSIEQIALLIAYSQNKDSTRLFDLDSYLNIMNGLNQESSIFKLVSKNISNRLTLNSKNLRLGLNCLINAYERFKEKDKNLISIQISSLFRDILNSLSQANNCRSRFAVKLIKFSLLRRRFLFTTIKNQESTGIWKDNDKKDYFIGFKFNSLESKSLIKDFIHYSACEQSFQSILSSRVIEIEQLIAQIPGCKGKKNFYAGMCYDKKNLQPTNNPFGDQIVKNNANDLGSNCRTQNNYFLNGGFGLGSGHLELTSEGYPALRYHYSIRDVIKNLINSFENKNSTWMELKDKINKNLNEYSGYRPTPNLHSKVFLNVLNMPKLYLKEFYETERGENCKGKDGDVDYFTVCKEISCTCYGSDCSMGNDPFILNWQDSMNTEKNYNSSNSNFSWNFNYSNIYVANICLKGARYIYAEAKDHLVGNLIDFIHSYKSKSDDSLVKYNLGAEFSLIQQTCIAVFHTGETNDKDSCRNPITPDCSKELDYKCKNGGLYDYIISNPVAFKFLPIECDSSHVKYSDENCFRWINFNFLSGTLEFKTSSFFSLNLKIQNSLSSLNDLNKNLQSDTFTNDEAEILADNKNDEATEEIDLMNKMKSYSDSVDEIDFSIDGAFSHTFPNLKSYLYDIEENINTLNNSSQSIKNFYNTIIVCLLILS